MKRGEIHFTGGCVPEAGTSGTEGCCLFCGFEWSEENCCGQSACPCQAMAEEWNQVSYKNVIMLITFWLSQPYGYFFERWYN